MIDEKTVTVNGGQVRANNPTVTGFTMITKINKEPITIDS